MASSLAQILEGDDFAPAPPAADTSAFSGPSAEPTPGDFLDQIAEQLFNHLNDTVGAATIDEMNREVDALLAELRQRLVSAG